MRAILVTADPGLTEQVEACAAAARVSLEVVETVQELRRWWRSADIVLVGDDRAAAVAGSALPERGRVHLVGGDAERLVGWSAPLQASVLVLPDHASVLSAVLDDRGSGASGGGQVLALVGGSGGLGVSSLAVALALAASRDGHRTALVDLARCGGGLDLLCGVERVPGWRWPDLGAASGHVGDLTGRLPRCAEIDLVSHAADGTDPGPAAVQAVLASLSRTHDLVVVDAGRGGEATAHARGLTWLVVGAEVRSVMAARTQAARDGLQMAHVVVRQGRGRGLDPAEVSSALELGLVGRVRDDSVVPTAAEVGDPPGRSPRSSLARDCVALLRALPLASAGVASDGAGVAGPRPAGGRHAPAPRRLA